MHAATTIVRASVRSSSTVSWLAILRFGALLLVPALTACGDIAGPPEAVEQVAGVDQSVEIPAVEAVRIEGSYESRVRVPLAGGRELYLVQVHFGTGDRADGATYLAQVGIADAVTSNVSVLQRTYRVSGEAIVFDGALLTPGTVSQRQLETEVVIGGQRVPVVLERMQQR